MTAYEFDGEKYRLASKHQKEWGNDLISELSLKGDETVLDLGCGDGILTERLALSVPHGKVLGIDASVRMIRTAGTIRRGNLNFACMDIHEMHFENEFDLIFSNAALHWVGDHARLLKNAFNALKPHGRILWDFGGAGNCANFLDVMQKKLSDEKYARYFQDFEWPWFMPSKSQYSELISGVGFSDVSIREIKKDRCFSNASEMIRWIDQPCIVPFISRVPQTSKEAFRREVIEEMLKRTRQPDGTYFETFRRLRIYAQKPAPHAQMQKIDLANWDRAQHYQVFRNAVQPQYCVTFELDITHFLKFIRKQGYSFTFSFVYAVSKCANAIKEFRYRFVKGEPVLFDRIHTAFTYLNQDTELFKVVNVEMTEALEEYVVLAAEREQAQKDYFTGPLGNDVFQFSAFPWAAYTHISHTDSGNKDNATPLFDWGKYYEKDGKILLPFSVQVHHSFVDGIHVGRLAQDLQEYLDQFQESELNECTF